MKDSDHKIVFHAATEVLSQIDVFVMEDCIIRRKELYDSPRSGETAGCFDGLVFISCRNS